VTGRGGLILANARAHAVPRRTGGQSERGLPAHASPWTEATVAALHAAGVTTRLVTVPGATHNLAGADLARANGLAVDWMGRCATGACTMPPS
jgi:hypothetical protein